jgi:hypothetical protein
MEKVIKVAGITAKQFQEALKTPANPEFYGEGEWRGTRVVLSLQFIDWKDYWLAQLASDKSVATSRSLCVSARGRTADEAVEILRSIVGE